jgi:hypothetical protein
VTVADVRHLTKSGVGIFTLRATLAQGEGFFVTATALDVNLKTGKVFHCATGRTTPIYPPGGIIPH